MTPSVGKLGGQSMPGAKPESGLKGIVIGSAHAVQLVDGAEVRELRKEWSSLLQSQVVRIVGRRSLVNVQHDRKLASLAANITYLKNASVANAALNLQVVVKEVGCPE